MGAVLQGRALSLQGLAEKLYKSITTDNMKI